MKHVFVLGAILVVIGFLMVTHTVTETYEYSVWGIGESRSIETQPYKAPGIVFVMIGVLISLISAMYISMSDDGNKNHRDKRPKPVARYEDKEEEWDAAKMARYKAYKQGRKDELEYSKAQKLNSNPDRTIGDWFSNEEKDNTAKLVLGAVVEETCRCPFCNALLAFEYEKGKEILIECPSCGGIGGIEPLMWPGD